MLSASAVTICVPAVVINELDKHKDEHPVRRIRKRAAKASVTLYEYYSGQKAEARPGVALRFLPFDTKVDFDRYNLRV